MIVEIKDGFKIERGPVTEFGWVRVPRLDTDTIDAWYTDYDRLYAARKGKMPWQARISREPSNGTE